MVGIDTLIVVAHNNNPAHLQQWLEYPHQYPVLIVDTGSPMSVLSPFQVAVNVVEQYEKVLGVVQTPYRGYDTGAYLWAFYNVPAKHYLFLQDSCFPREKDFVEQFKAKMPSMGAVGWSSFDISIWDNTAQCEATKWMYGDESKWPSKGIFGPIFFTSHKSLVHMRDSGLLPMPPVHKEQAQALERAWPILFHRAGMTVNFLNDEFEPRRSVMEKGGYPALTKIFRGRA